MARTLKGNEEGDLLFWWIPQIPGKAFERRINSIAEGRVLEEAFAMYDLFQLAERIKPDYSNMGGIVRWESDPDKPGEFDWFDVDEEEEDTDGVYRDLYRVPEEGPDADYYAALVRNAVIH